MTPVDGPPAAAENARITQALREMAMLLEAQGDHPYRIGAYRHAAEVVSGLGRSLREVLEGEGVAGLDALPGIGPRIAAAIAEMLDSGRWAQLERLRGTAEPEALLRAVPGVGAEPTVAMLLDVDREYREAGAAGKLAKIAPRRFNPQGLAWLPVLHTERPGWHFTALYSNTARAHELDRIQDWVVIYCEDALHRERQYTVVTAGRGGLIGRRVVRGRENGCRQWHATPQV